MIWIERTEPVKHLNQFGGDALRLAVSRAAMDDAMPDRNRQIADRLFLNPVHQGFGSRRVIIGMHRPRETLSLIQTVHPQDRVGKSDPLDPAVHSPPERFPYIEEGEFDARRSTIDRQDASISGFHRSFLAIQSKETSFAQVDT
jgi:hypothetical protein